MNSTDPWEFLWRGKPSGDMTREELIEVIRYLWVDKERGAAESKRQNEVLNGLGSQHD